MNNPTLRTSQPSSAAGTPLAALAFDDDEDTTPSTPYVPHGHGAMRRLRWWTGPLLRAVIRWFAAVRRRLRGR